MPAITDIPLGVVATLESLGRPVAVRLVTTGCCYDCDGLTLGFTTRNDAGAVAMLNTMPTPNAMTVDLLKTNSVPRKLDALIEMLRAKGTLTTAQVKTLSET